MADRTLPQYEALLGEYLAGVLDSYQFEGRYLQLFKHDHEHHSDDIFNTLSDFFFEVDAFCADPELRGEDDVDEQQLRAAAREALDQLSRVGA